MSSDNLGAPSVAVGQAQKEVTINEAVNKLDNATQGVTALTITGTRLLTAAEFTGGYSLELSGTPGAGFTLNVPASRRSFRVDNATDGDATVQVDGGAGASVVVPAASAAFLYSDGADITEEGGGGTTDPNAVHDDTTTTLTVGYSHTPHAIGTITSGTVTPDEADGAMQSYTNGGAHALAPPANSTSIHVVITNDASAGAITTAGFTITTGDPFTTTDGHVFGCSLVRNGSFTHLHVTAGQ